MPGSPRQRRLVIAAVDALLLDQPAAVELHAEIVIEAHGVERPGVPRRKPLHYFPIGAHRNPVRGALEVHVLHPVLTATPPWLGEGLARPAPHGNTLSGRRLHDAIWGECCDHTLDTARVVGPHVAPQHILDAKAIVHADLGCHCQIPPSLSELQRPILLGRTPGCTTTVASGPGTGLFIVAPPFRTSTEGVALPSGASGA